jgi:phospholipid transport system substrate-binding protein
MKRLLAYLIVVLGLGLTFNVSAEAKTYSSPTEFIEEFNNKSLTIFMKDIDTNQEYKEVSKLIENYFDIKGIGLYSLGDTRKNLNSTQIKKYNNSFKKYWIKSFYKREALFTTSSSYKVVSKKILNKNYTLITTLNDENKKIEWRVYTKDTNKLQIRDVIINGYSLARTQKEEFQSILKENNFNIKELIIQLTEF